MGFELAHRTVAPMRVSQRVTPVQVERYGVWPPARDRKKAAGKKHNAEIICPAPPRVDVLHAMLRNHPPPGPVTRTRRLTKPIGTPPHTHLCIRVRPGEEMQKRQPDAGGHGLTATTATPG
ncbi:MAG: hypothetical protein GEU94_22300 [Micromonosporaceae bacterium]|nr:hypothetical protein [Micromonosporaceae bacterium]